MNYNLFGMSSVLELRELHPSQHIIKFVELIKTILRFFSLRNLKGIYPSVLCTYICHFT